MEYTTITKLPLCNDNYDNCGEDTKESSPMYSSFTPDTALQSRSSFSSSSLKRIGTIKLLILAIIVPIMFLTIVNPMWICIFMKYPHVHRYTPNNVHTGNAHVHPQSHSHSYKGGIKITKETFDVVVASKDGHFEELETTITVIENISPNSENHKQHDSKINTAIKSKSESTMDRIRERLFKSRKSCAYFALSIMMLCAVAIYGVACFSSDDIKMYESVNDDDNHNVRIEYNDDKTIADDERLNESNVTEVNQNVCITECTQVQIDDDIVQINDNTVNINDNISTLTPPSPPPYSSNTDNELIFISTVSTSSENIRQSTNKNQ